MKKVILFFAVIAFFPIYNCIPEAPERPEPIPEPTVPSLICGEGFHPVGNRCVSDTEKKDKQPIPENSSAICGEGTHQVGDKCLSDNPAPSPNSTEICDNLTDDDHDNLIDEGCSPQAPQSTEICENGVDDNGDGQVDENCSPLSN